MAVKSKNKGRLIYGFHAVQSQLLNSPKDLVEVWCDQKRGDKRIAQLLELCAKSGVNYHIVDHQAMDKIAPGARHQGVIARIQKAPSLAEADLYQILEKLEGPALLLVLDSVQDPHNLGACLRSADGAGVHAVIAPKDRSASITPVVNKVASGATQSVPFVQVTNLARTLEKLKHLGVWLVGTDDKGEQSLYDMDLGVPVAIVMGGEGSGLRRLTKEKCDFLVRIPMTGVVESLNVSVCAGVCLYEALRQRKFIQNPEIS